MKITRCLIEVTECRSYGDLITAKTDIENLLKNYLTDFNFDFKTFWDGTVDGDAYVEFNVTDDVYTAMLSDGHFLYKI